jgi:glycosyltransferase involved in cell wall biosynthesis
MVPYFSVIVPAYNREREVQRALESCLTQDFKNFEVIVTDDASEDGTANVVASFAEKDPRVKLVRHAQNRGVCPARNSAIAQACGTWLLMVDSDASLLPGALTSLHSITQTAAPSVGNVATRKRWDTGELSPSPENLVVEGILKYEQYIAWMASLKSIEYMNCIRKEVFDKGTWYPDSRAYEQLFHLNLMHQWDLLVNRTVTVVYHTDSTNRLCDPQDLSFAKRLLLRNAHDHAENGEAVLKVHGEVLKRLSPKSFDRLLFSIAWNRFIEGKRVEGFTYGCKCLQRKMTFRKIGKVMIFGLMGSRVLVSTHMLTQRLKQKIAPNKV